MTTKRATVLVRDTPIEIDYRVTDEGDVEEWSTVDRSLEPSLTEEDCMWIDHQLFLLEGGDPTDPAPTLKGAG